MKAIFIFCNNQQHQQQRQQLPSNDITTAMAWSNIYNRYWSCLCFRDSVCNFKITFFIDLDVAHTFEDNDTWRHRIWRHRKRETGIQRDRDSLTYRLRQNDYRAMTQRDAHIHAGGQL